MELVTWIALGSLLISAIAVIRSSRADRRSNEIADDQKEIASEQRDLNERLVEIEEARRDEETRQQESAEVSVDLLPSGKSSEIVLRNHGPAPAEDVRVEIKMSGEGDEAYRSPSEEDIRGNPPGLPVDLDPGGREVWRLAFHMGFAPPLDARVSWNDGRGERIKRETTLTK